MTSRPVAVWFEIPAADFERAVVFYETILGLSLKREAMGPQTLAVFPYERPATSGCILGGSPIAPGEAGTIVYLDATGKLEAALAALDGAGGRQLTPVIDLPPGMGRFVHIRDSEGNRVGLHAGA